MIVLQVSIVCYCLMLAAFLLLDHRGKVESNRLLAAMLATLAAIIGLNIAAENALWFQAPLLRRALPFLLGPLFYLFVRALVYRREAPGASGLWHLAPAGAVLLAGLSWSEPALRAPLLGLTFCSLLVYLALCQRLVGTLRRALLQCEGRGDAQRLTWVSRTIYGLFAMTALEMAELGLAWFGYRTGRWLYLADMALLAVLVGGLVLEALRQPAMFAGLAADDDFLLRAPGAAVASPDAPAQARAPDALLRTNLLAALERDRVYTEPGLNLKTLADLLGVSPRTLSQAINEGFGRNFSDFINGYRIRAAQARLRDPGADHLSILDILHEVGFSSKSTFNLMFKRELGMSPSQWRARRDREAP